MKKTITTLFLIIGFSSANSQNVSLLANVASNIQCIAIDATNNIYVGANNTIFKVSTNSVVTILAGSSTGGNADGLGAAASFSNPMGLCVDASGNVYVADQGNFKIRKITPTGSVSTFVGSGTAGTVNATGTGASLQNPTGIWITPSGDFYFTDQMNFGLPMPWYPKVRKITPAGVVSDVCTTNGNCQGITVTNNTVFVVQPVANPGPHCIYAKDLSTASTTVYLYAGTNSGYLDGALLTAKFSEPRGITTDGNGNLFVADNGGHRIRHVSSSSVTTIAGAGGTACQDGPALSATFWGPNSIARAANGDLYIGDYFCGSVRKITGLTPTSLNSSSSLIFSAKAYPNPSKDFVSIDLFDKQAEFQNAVVIITNMFGQTISSQTFDAIDNKINVKEIPTGIYTMQLKNNNQQTSIKFIKE